MTDPLMKDTVTVYNRYISQVFNPPMPPTDSIKYSRTVIYGCMWKDDVRINSASDGKSLPGKTVSITAPLEADQSGKAYIRPDLYAKLPDNSSHWTIRTDTTNPDIIVFGEAPEITALYTVDQLKREFKYTYPREISDSTEQNILPMWKIRGV